MTPLRLDRERVRAMFRAAGFEDAAAWDARTMTDVIAADRTPSPRAFLDVEHADLADAIWTAVRNKRPVMVTDPGHVPPGGVLDTLVALLRTADAGHPMSREALHAELVRRFPGRRSASLMATIVTHVPSRLQMRRFLNVRGNAEGYWIETPGVGG